MDGGGPWSSGPAKNPRPKDVGFYAGLNWMQDRCWPCVSSLTIEYNLAFLSWNQKGFQWKGSEGNTGNRGKRGSQIPLVKHRNPRPLGVVRDNWLCHNKQPGVLE